MTQQYDDPFAVPERHPAVSWKDKPIGTRVVGNVVEAPKLVQSRDYDTGDPAWWDDAKTQPKMSVVTVLDINGERFGLWAQKPSALFAALGEAQSRANARIEVGGTLTVEYVGDKPNPDKPRLAPAKQFRASYSPPNAFDTAPAQQQQPAQSSMVDAEPPF